MQIVYAVLCQPHHKDTFSTFIYALIWSKTACSCSAADTEQRTQFASSGYSPKRLYGDATESQRRRIVWINRYLFSLRRKSVLVASLNSDWTTDGRWTILTMSFILFWALTVLFTWQSMGQSQAPGFHPKYLKLCSEDERSFYGLERHEGKWLKKTFSFWGGVTL